MDSDIINKLLKDVSREELIKIITKLVLLEIFLVSNGALYI